MGDPSGKGWPPAGSESCVACGRPVLRSVDSECLGRVIEPRNDIFVGADVFKTAESSTGRAVIGLVFSVPPGSKSRACTHQGSPGTREVSFSPVGVAARAPLKKWSGLAGKHRDLPERMAIDDGYGKAKATKLSRMEFEKSESADSTDESGEPT